MEDKKCMTISELIDYLKDQLETVGDLPVYTIGEWEHPLSEDDITTMKINTGWQDDRAEYTHALLIYAR